MLLILLPFSILRIKGLSVQVVALNLGDFEVSLEKLSLKTNPIVSIFESHIRSFIALKLLGCDSFRFEHGCPRCFFFVLFLFLSLRHLKQP